MKPRQVKEIDKILQDIKTHDIKLFYLVKWVGEPVTEASWEPAKNLAHLSSEIETYHKKVKKLRPVQF